MGIPHPSGRLEFGGFGPTEWNHEFSGILVENKSNLCHLFRCLKPLPPNVFRQLGNLLQLVLCTNSEVLFQEHDSL